MEFYLAFYKSKNPNAEWDDKLIDWYTGSIGFSHVEIVVVYKTGKKEMYTSSPRDGGVRAKEHIWDENVWEYERINITFSHLTDIFTLTNGCKYDWNGILGFILPFQDRTNKWFCSEWCSNVLKTAGDKRFLILEPSKLSPNKLYKIIKGE